MLNAIFRIDWVFIDVIIITLLFLLLVIVRIFKSTHRWRSSFSNISLESLYYPQELEDIKSKFFLIKKLRLTKNSSLEDNNSTRPVIFIIRTNYKQKLLRILTEGLSSYGFSVINLRIKIINSFKLNILEKSIMNELNSLISSLLDTFNKKELLNNSNYLLLNHSGLKFPLEAVISDKNNAGMVLLNPRITLENIKNYYNEINNSHQNPQLFAIFSKNSFFISNKKNRQSILNDYSSTKKRSINIISLDNAKNSFKYYETVILGIIIDIIDNKILDSKI